VLPLVTYKKRLRLTRRDLLMFAIGFGLGLIKTAILIIIAKGG